ncbi:class I adenylate-forming enzyme family protein [Peterkaempfera sp. SMS 1(5)a]|uniref:class I adenylate-forming enzyme family protein n=1 Tax=Peterkaempfera podocarpi TaxID=3232308 RepID=UPI00366E2843
MAAARVSPLVAALDAAAEARPDAPAVSEGAASTRWTYAELADASRAVSSWLRGPGGVRPGDRVVLRIGNRMAFAALYYGVLRAGAVAVPLSPEMRPYLLAAVLADAQPRVVVHQEDETGRGLEAARACGAVLATSDMLLASPARRGAGETDVAVAPDSVGQLIYTSGSTSTPKGVVCTHTQVDFAARAIGARLGYRPDDVVLGLLPLSFDYGLYQLLLSVAAGAELVLGEATVPTRALALLRSRRATVVPVVPSLAAMLVRLVARGELPRHVRLFTNTGAALPQQCIEALRAGFPGAAVVAMYGITECKRVTIGEPDGDLLRPGSVGRPLPGTSVRIVDADGAGLPAGQLGEIVVSGPHVMSGYWGAPELTAQRFRHDPTTGASTLHTGDYGRLDEEGHLYFAGRRDDQFKRRGVRTSSTEIEGAALDIAGVTAAAALPPRDGLDLRLAVTASLTADEVLVELGRRLESAKVPSSCVLLESFPLTANGKIDRKALHALRF